jgi:hypothetical protein
MKKYLVEVLWKEPSETSPKIQDTMIVTSVDNYMKACKKIDGFLLPRYKGEVVLDKHINSFDVIEKIKVL